MRRFALTSGFVLLALVLSLMSTKAQEQKFARKITESPEDLMSSMGHLAAAKARAREFLKTKVGKTRHALTVPNIDDDVEPPDDSIVCDDDGCEVGGEDTGPGSTQSEVAIAMDPTGAHVVVAFNDFRGFNSNPLSISGFAYSDDGGLHWTDGGQLPAPTNGNIGTAKLPQVSGDPDVKNVGGCNFIYSSIMVKGIGVGTSGNTFAGSAQTMSIHRSVDCGHTWTGPFEVTAASNPHGALSGSNARDAADKELIDVDPDTGRVIMTWTNFSSSALTGIPAGVEIRSTYSDDITTGNPPTWSPGVVLNSGSSTFDTGSVPRFARNGSANVYVAWSASSLSAFTGNTFVARSTDNGVTWGPPIALNGAQFFVIDFILGNDRVHSFPGMAVGPEGNVYVAYASNNNRDGSDIAFHRSTNGGVSFSPAVLLNARPGLDRSQWFPYVTADPTTGRVYVTYYTQVGNSGDLTASAFIFSDDGGVTWSRQSQLTSPGCVGIQTDPLDCRPFHAGYGNDTSQPNLGDYIGATTFSGDLFAVWAGTTRLTSFVDGQPDSSFTTPDFYVNRVNSAKAALALAGGGFTFTDSGGNGFVDAGDRIALKVNISNFVTNAISSPTTYSGITGTLTTSTPGVTIVTGTAPYPNIAPGASATNVSDFIYSVSPSFVPGTRIEFALNISSAQGSNSVMFTQNTGTPVGTTIFSQNFNGVSAGALPTAWTTIHAGGANTVPWTTSDTFCGTTSNALFHANANDGVGGTGNPTRFERVASPNIAIPSVSEFVTIDMDVCYDTEDDPNFNVLAYDGMDLRITDFTTGHFARAEFVEAFAEFFTTGSANHYPKHNPRSSSSAYLQDMSLWAGDSQGFKHVFLRIPGMQGTTVQLRPDYTQDSSGICSDVRPGHTCGVMIDNIVVRSVVTKSDELSSISLTPVLGSPGVFNGVVASQPIAGGSGIVVNLTGSVSTGNVSISPASVTIPAGSQTSPGFTVTLSSPDALGSVTATGPSNARSASITGTTIGATAGQYSDGVTFTAAVSPNVVSGQTASGNVTFMVNGTAVGSSPINSAGLAVLPYTIALGQGSYSTVAIFSSTNPLFGGSLGANTLTVSRENAVVTAVASNASTVQVTSPGGTANFALSATVQELPDGSLGDIANGAPVTFNLLPLGPGSAISRTAVSSGGGVGGTATAKATFSNVPVNVYEVQIQVDGNFYTGSSSAVIAVFDPSLGFVTGGGTIVRDDVKANFGLNFKYLKNGNAQGQMVYIEHRATGDVVVKSNAIESLSIVGNQAIIIGKANVNDAGNHRFRAIVIDAGEPGKQDQFGLQITTANGTVVPGLTFNPIPLAGGNVQVPQP